MHNQGSSRQGSRILAILAAAYGLVACGNSSSEPVDPRLIVNHDFSLGDLIRIRGGEAGEGPTPPSSSPILRRSA